MTELLRLDHLAEVIENGERFQVLKLDNGITVTLAAHYRIEDAQVGDTVEVCYTATSLTSSGSGFYYGVKVVEGGTK